MSNDIRIPAAADFHVHLRDGQLMETVVPTIRKGGVNVVYVMPNLVPPITTVDQALHYRTKLRRLEPNVHYLMSLYLTPAVTPRTIYEASAAGITGVKSYPAGVTTNSDAGVVNYEAFYPVFAAMEEVDMVLNLHGEMPPSPDTTVLNAEEKFLPTLLEIHRRFPKLRIVLEHCTTAKAVEAVKSCGPSVAATITAHHLVLTIDEAVGRAHNFCKPVAKLPSDREALIEAATSGNPKFFMGTDSAPHVKSAKEGARSAAGCFTQAHAVGYVADVFRAAGKLDMLEGFVSRIGRTFYKVEELGVKESIVLSREPGEVIKDEYGEGDGAVVPFLAGETTYSVEWK